MIQHHSQYLKPMLSIPGPTISASPHQPVPGGGTRRDHTSRAKFDTIAARDERACGRASHWHHQTRRATPVATVCGTLPGSSRAKCSGRLKSHAAAWNHPTLHSDRHSSASHSPAQAFARAITSATWVRARLQLDTCFLGTHLVGSESSTRRPCAAPHVPAWRVEGVAE